MSQEVRINGDRINGISYNLLINGAYFGENPFRPLLSSWDIQVAFCTIPLTAPNNLMVDVTPKGIKLVMSALTLCDCNVHSSAIDPP